MATHTLPLDNVMMSLRRKALELESRLDDATVAGGETGAVVDEHADTWGFSWMPAIEDFVDQAAAAARGEDHGSNAPHDMGDSHGDDSGVGRNNTAPAFFDPAGGGGGKRKRMRPSSSGDNGAGKPSNRGRRPPRPPSYNEILLADKAFHNPHGLDTMADAFGIMRPFSFAVDVSADDRTWGGQAAAAAAAATAEGTVGNGAGEQGVPEQQQEVKSGDVVEAENSRSWFYDTVRDRQNRLWADTRVKKGVELARKGQHQSAIDTYTQALGMCPDHEDGLVARGAAYATTGRLRQALQDLSRALSLNPANENATSYLRETRRRMNRQDAKLSPTSSAATSTGGGDRSRDQGLKPWDNAGATAAKISKMGGLSSVVRDSGTAGSDDAARSALVALMQDGADGDALRKMRLLLEEDARSRKHRDGGSIGREEDEGGVGVAAETSSTSSASDVASKTERIRYKDRENAGDDKDRRSKKKSSKKDKKKKSSSSSKSARRSSSHHHQHRKRHRDQDGSVGDSNSSADEARATGGGSGATKKHKKKKKNRGSSGTDKKKRRSRGSGMRSMSPPPDTGVDEYGRNSSGGTSKGVVGGASRIDATWGEDSDGDDVHPILQRKKHSLWG